MIHWEFQGDYSFNSGELAFENIKNKEKGKLGIFSSNDQMALGFLHSALESGAEIPGDFGIIGYDNMPYSKVFYPKLSTIDTNLDLLANNTLDYIVQRIKKTTEKAINPTTTLLPVDLIERRTHTYEKL